MATSANKRKQDEKHLKMLREMVALPHNKQCFDCHQRGPTYVNMTIGSYVCTSCSGLLRGLNPPHRVKSISMTTFTPDEMELLKARGNHFCQKVWLARFNSQLHREPDSKDEHKVREFMSDKYEKKKHHAEPTESLHEEARQMNTPAKQPDTKPLRGLAGNSLPSLRVGGDQSAAIPKPVAPPPQAPGAPATAAPAPQIQNAAQSQPQQAPASSGAHPPGSHPAGPHPGAAEKKSGFDLLSDLGGDPFAPPAAPAASNHGFANFADFSGPTQTPAFAAPVSTPASQAAFAAFSAAPPTAAQPHPHSQAPPHAQPPPAAAPNSFLNAAGDRYAALADLDTVFGGGSSGGQTVNWDSGFGGSGGAPLLSGGGNSSPWGPPQTSQANLAASSSAFGGLTTSTAVFGQPTQSTDRTNPWASNGYHSNMHSGLTDKCQVNNPFYVLQQVANPFGQTVVSSAAFNPAVGNPFMAGGGVPGAGGQHQGFGGAPFGGAATAAAAAAAQGHHQYGGATVQNGGYGASTVLATQHPHPQHGAQGWGPAPGAAYGVPPAAPASKASGAYGAPLPQHQQQQQQQFAAAGWGVQPAGNPFMAMTAQQAAPPRGNPTNPFL